MHEDIKNGVFQYHVKEGATQEVLVISVARTSNSKYKAKDFFSAFQELMNEGWRMQGGISYQQTEHNVHYLKQVLVRDLKYTTETKLLTRSFDMFGSEQHQLIEQELSECLDNGWELRADPYVGPGPVENGEGRFCFSATLVKKHYILPEKPKPKLT
ncbi:hypothetical protein [Neptuniibacter sp. QD37_11]|uniref:hypothetical protein n=1 Tax=Neptuniibacter sp. QD37_11 TaxID=3398209 RepID=UPI0039F56A18